MVKRMVLNANNIAFWYINKLNMILLVPVFGRVLKSKIFVECWTGTDDTWSAPGRVQ